MGAQPGVEPPSRSCRSFGGAVRAQNTSLPSASVSWASRSRSGLDSLIRLQLWVAGNQPRGGFGCTTPEQEARADICCFGRPASMARLFLAKVPQLPHGEFPPCVQPGEGAARPDAPSFRAKGWACSPGWVNSPPSPRMGHSFLVMMASPKGVTESPLLSKMLRLHPHWGLSASPVLLPFCTPPQSGDEASY